MRTGQVILPAIALSVPIAPLAFNGVDIPISDFVCLVGIFLSVKYANLLFTKLLYLSIFLSFIAGVIVAAFVAPTIELRPLLSIAYFFKPYFALFVALYVIRGREDIRTIFRTLGYASAVTLVSVLISIVVVHGGIVREESVLNGSILGLPVYGAYGVNSLAVFYLLLYFIVLFWKQVDALTLQEKVVRLFSLCVLSYLIFFSLSREAILGYVVLQFFFVVQSNAHRSSKVALLVLGVVAVTLIMSLDVTTAIWEAKIKQVVEAVQESDLDKLSSGRVGLYIATLDQVRKNFVFGTGFHGYQLYTDSLYGFDTVEGLSPHNQYLTSIWKMGLIPAIPYFFALYSLFRMTGLLRGTRTYSSLVALLFVVFFILANVWDVLIIPNFAALLFFLWGGIIKSASVKGTVKSE